MGVNAHGKTNGPPSYEEAAFRGSERGQCSGDRLIIALDFGTTYSGIEYAFSNCPDKVFTIDSFPGGDRIVPKVPTTIRYAAGSKTAFAWGYELDGRPGERLERVKLLFDPDQPLPYYISGNVQAEVAKLPKAVEEVAADYMRAIFQHAMTEIEGDAIDPAFISAFEKQYILTVPAVWSDKAKAMTRKAAEMAGISPVEMITEPEAAAMYTLSSMKNRGLKVKDAILVCDAGGGTADLIAYEIISLAPFEVKALTIPSGGLAGSSMINKMLEDEVLKAVGDEAFINLRKTDGYRNALREFDVAIKVAFTGRTDRDKHISFPMANLKDNPEYGLVKDAMKLSGTTVLRFFDPIIREVDRLVKEQVTKVKTQRLQANPLNAEGVKAIFLVGGFGSNGYLKDVMQRSHRDIMVVQPKEAWSAIVRGAVMSKLPASVAPVVLSSKAWKHYGTRYSCEYDVARDRGFPTYVNRWTEDTECECMDWFIKMDEELVRGKQSKLRFCRRFSTHKPSARKLIVRDWLYESTACRAPVHPGQDSTFNCELVTDLSQVSKRQFVKKYRASDGMPYCELSYSLQIENDASGLLKFSLEIDGKEYSAVQAKY